MPKFSILRLGHGDYSPSLSVGERVRTDFIGERASRSARTRESDAAYFISPERARCPFPYEILI